MKLKELFGGKGVWVGAPMKIRNLYNQKDLDQAINGKVTAQTVTLKNAQTGEITGHRTIYQK